MLSTAATLKALNYVDQPTSSIAQDQNIYIHPCTRFLATTLTELPETCPCISPHRKGPRISIPSMTRPTPRLKRRKELPCTVRRSHSIYVCNRRDGIKIQGTLVKSFLEVTMPTSSRQFNPPPPLLQVLQLCVEEFATDHAVSHINT